MTIPPQTEDYLLQIIQEREECDKKDNETNAQYIERKYWEQDTILQLIKIHLMTKIQCKSSNRSI